MTLFGTPVYIYYPSIYTILTLNRLALNAVQAAILFLHVTKCKLTSEKKNFVYALTLQKIFNQHFVLCRKSSTKLNFEIFIKAADYNYPCKLPEINTCRVIFVTDS